MKRGALILVIFVALLALACGFGASTAALYLTQPAASANTTVNFVVNKGDSTADVANNLQKAGLIRNAQVFRLLARYRHLDTGIQAGVYKLHASMTMDQIIAQLQLSKPDLVIAGVPEALRVVQYPSHFSELANFNAKNFLQIVKTGKLNDGTPVSQQYWYVLPQQPNTYYALEGYLYPDFYSFDVKANEQDVIKTMLDAFGQHLCPGPKGSPNAYIHDKAACKAHAATSGKNNDNIFTMLEQKYFEPDDAKALYLALTLGSIVMREIRNYDDAQGVANVYYNRYLHILGKLDSDVGNVLQADPTTQYARDTETPPAAGTAYWTQIQDSPANVAPKNPYNTYVAQGLPPGPISAPFWPVLKAAIDPNPDGPTPNFYFLNDNCTGHIVHYAATNDAFNVIKAKYLDRNECP